MIISCEKCATKYNINKDFIGKNGRKVKCTQCNYIWHANFVEDEVNIAPKLEKIISKNVENTLPVKIEKLIPLWMKMLPYPLIFLIMSIHIIFYSDNVINFIPTVEPLYNYFGLSNSKGLKLENLILSKINKNDGSYDILIEGKIVNTNKNNSTLPSLRLSILDYNKKNIISDLSESDGSIMAAGGELTINNKITNLDERAKFIAVDIGNKVELMIR